MTNYANVRSQINDATIWMLTNQFVHALLFLAVFIYTGVNRRYLPAELWPLFLYTLPLAAGFILFHAVIAVLRQQTSITDHFHDQIKGRIHDLPHISAHLAGHIVGLGLFQHPPEEITIQLERGKRDTILARITHPSTFHRKADLLAAIKMHLASGCAESVLHGDRVVDGTVDQKQAECHARKFLNSCIGFAGVHYPWYRNPTSDQEVKLNATTLSQFLSDMHSECMEFVTANDALIRETAAYLQHHVGNTSSKVCMGFARRAPRDD